MARGEDIEPDLKHDAIPPVTNTPCRKGPHLYVKYHLRLQSESIIIIIIECILTFSSALLGVDTA